MSKKIVEPFVVWRAYTSGVIEKMTMVSESAQFYTREYEHEDWFSKEKSMRKERIAKSVGYYRIFKTWTEARDFVLAVFKKKAEDYMRAAMEAQRMLDYIATLQVDEETNYRTAPTA